MLMKDDPIPSGTVPGRVMGKPDEALVDRSLARADLNALRLALYQLTVDPELEQVPLEQVPVRGGASWALVPAAQSHEMIRAKAKAVLMAGTDTSAELPATSVSDAQLRSLMELLGGGRPLDDSEFAFHKEQYALEKFPRGARWTAGRPALPAGFRVGIIGAGFSGIATAIQLEQLGIPYVIFEREQGAGGTWRVNNFPDARVDTSSFIYQYSFEKRYPWSEYFARQAEVRDYVEAVARKYDVLPKVRFGTAVEAAEFDAGHDCWELRFENPALPPERVNVLVAASGLFSTPKRPDIPGLDTFTGTLVHSTEWTDDIPVQGRRFAVLGNGSTGVQIMPKLAASGAANVACFQRTAQWISPLENYGAPIPAETRWLLSRMPYYWNWFCYSMVRATFVQQDAQVVDPEWQGKGGLVSQRNDKLREILTRYIQEQLKERPDLIPRVTPDYPPLARRLIVDNGWYKPLLSDNVELVTTGIECITPTGVRTCDGKDRTVDTIVMASGFEAEKYLFPMKVTGRDGASLEKTWDGDPRAYLGMTVPSFPNLFIMYGPNSQPRAGSLVCWFEVWSQHAARAVVALLERKASRIEVKQSAFDAYQARLDRANDELVWKLGPKGRNYYVNAKGRPQVNCPLRIEEYRDLFHRPWDAAYDIL